MRPHAQTFRLRPGRGARGPAARRPAAVATRGAGKAEAAAFSSAMAQALGGGQQPAAEAAALQREVQLDNPTVSLEQTMVAMQKAQIGFQATLQVRNRLVQAYSDIMNMQV